MVNYYFIAFIKIWLGMIILILNLFNTKHLSVVLSNTHSLNKLMKQTVY